jgi:RNA polymerase sigma-70 factor (ECF subfamily)
LNQSAGHNEKMMEVIFSELFRKHEHKLYTLVLRLTKSDHVAKDVLQEVFLKLWTQRSTLHTIHNIEAWLYRITENKIIDFLRKASADNRLKNNIWTSLQQRANESEQLLEVKEYNQIIQKAINQLPPQRRLIYRLNKEDGMNYEQIATELHISKHTVKNQLFSAIQSLRRLLTNKKQEE